MKALKITLYWTMLMCVFASNGLAKYSGGNGFSEPWQIANLDDWNELVGTSGDWDKHFVLTADLDLDGIVYTAAPIAPDIDNTTPDHQGTTFVGSLKGQGHTIYNLTINAPDQDYVGLIGNLNGGNIGLGLVKNLFLENVNIQGRNYVGSIAGLVRNWCGTVEYCSVSGTVSGNQAVGGLVGQSWTGNLSGTRHLAYCVSTVNVQGNHRVGGLVGHNIGPVFDCCAIGAVSGTSQIGGLIGFSDGVDIPVFRVYAAGEVSGSTDVGGLIGRNQSGIPVVDSFWDENVSGQTVSAGGTGLSTSQMQAVQTYLTAGWDFVGESVNGTDDIWKMSVCTGYPTFSWLPPCNDTMADGASFEIDQIVSTDSIMADGTDITLLGYNDWADVWFYFDCEETDQYTVIVDPDDFDSTLAVFDAAGVEMIFNDDFFGGKSAVILKAAADRRYYIRVAGYDGQTGQFSISLQQGAIQAIQGDLNYDGVVNLADFAMMAANWLGEM